MTNRLYHVAVCALSAREERIVGIILARVPSARFRYEAVADNAAQTCDIVLVDPHSKDSDALLESLRARHPKIVAVFISDVVTTERKGYRVSRRSLWSNLVTTLDEIVLSERNGGGEAIRAASAPAAAASGAVPGAAREAAPAATNLRALILDDSITVRNQIEAALHALGIDADGAASWDAAHERIERTKYDLMFLDVIMPGIDGYEVCRRLRRNAPTRQLPVIMLTSRSSTFDRARGALAGCDVYLIKPIDLRAFHQAVNKIVAKLCRNDPVRARQRGFLPADNWPGAAISH
ncbi:MAG TPA: response regulator [Tahibacter sp.]|nr:response regulator [Tahibacter sp.]